MGRRTLLRGLAGSGAVALGGVAGCLAPATNGVPADGVPTGASDPDGTPDPAGGSSPPIAELGIPATICEEEPSADPGIYAVIDPAFGDDWIDPRPRYGELTDDDVVVGLERGGEARAYPLSVLRFHEVVNDELDVPVTVTYCPLCSSGLVADRRVEGRTREFLVSGLLWRPPQLESRISESRGTVFGADEGGETEVRSAGNLVMYDRESGSYWSQVLGTAICGPLRGIDLRILPSTVATWGDWRADHPDTGVLLPPPTSGTVAPDAGGSRRGRRRTCE